MCGFVAIFDRQAVALSAISSCTDQIKHRGPNDFGYATGGKVTADQTLDHLTHLEPSSQINFALGHRRLSILDLSERGRQPFIYLNRYCLVYNGEVYNYLELKKSLEKKGVSFSTDSDTEVIAAAYHAYGTECFPLFNGMWAFVLIDLETNEVVVARDHFGIKPLYYYADADRLIFASEIKAILAHPNLNITPNIEGCKTYLKTGTNEFDKETCFNQIFRFPFAHYFKTDLNQMIQQGLQPIRYWDPKSIKIDQSMSEAQAVKEYLNQLEESVKIRLRADVPLGAALSGGLDSSSIVYLTQKILKKTNPDYNQLETFSCIHPSAETRNCDESDYISMLSQHLSVHSNTTDIPPDTIPEQYYQMIYSMDTPPENSHMSGWYTFKLIANSKVTVNLDGQGADELVAGYERYLASYLTYADLGDVLKTVVSFSPRPEFRSNLLVGIAGRFLRIFRMERLLNPLMKTLGKRIQPAVPLETFLLNDVSRGLVNLLHYMDRTSMAFSIESRVPFLDVKLVEFLLSVPGKYKFSKGFTKYLCRKAFEGKLPPEIVYRKDKMGWPSPHAYWFNGPLKNWALAAVTQSEFLKTVAPNFDSKSELTRDLNGFIRHLNLALWHACFFVPSSPHYFKKMEAVLIAKS